MAEPLISVIIPCYNDGVYLDEAVESVLQQTYQNFEIVVVNDGSKEEKTKNILKNYSKPKTTIINIGHQGVATARNVGIANARGKYILPLDADDKIAKTYLEKVMRVLEQNSEVGIVYCEAELFGTVQQRWLLPDYSLEEMLIHNLIFNSAGFRKKDWETVGGYNSNMKDGLEDYDFWLSLLELGVKVIRIPEVLFYYRIKTEARNTSKLLHMRLQMLDNHMELFVKNIQALVKREPEKSQLASLYLNTGRGYNALERIGIKYLIPLNRKVRFEYDLSNCGSIASVRFDPVEGHWVKVKVDKITYDRNDGSTMEVALSALSSNGQTIEKGYFLFHTHDPQIDIPVSGRINRIEIVAGVEVLSMAYIDTLVSNLEKH